MRKLCRTKLVAPADATFSQRAFKLRRSQYQKALQQKVELLEENHQHLLNENDRLRNVLEMEKAVRSGLVEGMAGLTERSMSMPA